MNDVKACSLIPITELLDCIVDNRGKSCPTCETGFPLIATNCIKHTSIYPTFENIRYVSDDTLHNWFRAELKPNDILFVNKGTPGRVCLVPDPITFCAAQDMIGLRANPQKIYYKYLFAVLRSDFIQEKIANFHVGIAIPHFKKSDMDNLLIPVPSMDVQIKIGDLYCELSEKIENNNKIQNELDLMLNTIYKYWFIQFDFPTENGKPYKSSGGKMKRCEQLNIDVPIDWEVSTLKGKYCIERGLSYTSKDIEAGKGVPMINLACIDINRNYRDGELKFHSGKVSESSMLQNDDLLIACTDLTRNADIVGSPILVPDDDNKYTYSMDIAKMIPNQNYFNRYYLYMALRTDFYHNYIKRWASGTNVLHLNLDGLDWYTTWIPPLELQEKFACIVKDTHSKKCNILKANQELSKTRDYLLPLLLNGQIGFKEA